MVESSSKASSIMAANSTENEELVLKRKMGSGRGSRAEVKKGADLRGLPAATCTRMNNSVVT